MRDFLNAIGFLGNKRKSKRLGCVANCISPLYIYTEESSCKYKGTPSL